MKRAVFVTLLGSLTLATWSSGLQAQISTNGGWINGSEWNHIVGLQNPQGCAEGLTTESMQGAWVPVVPSIQEGDYKAGDLLSPDWSQSVVADLLGMGDHDLDPGTDDVLTGSWAGGLNVALGAGLENQINVVDQPTLDDLMTAAGLPAIRGMGDLLNYDDMMRDLSALAVVVATAAGGTAPNSPCGPGRTSGDLVCDNVDVAQPFSNNGATAIATTYVENKTAGPLLIGICTSSDDAVAVWVNELAATLQVACRGSQNGCDNGVFLVFIPPGSSKITMQVWERGGGFNGRCRVLDPTTGEAFPVDSPLFGYLGTGVDNPAAVTQVGVTEQGPNFVRSFDGLLPFDCPNLPGEPVTVTISETSGNGDPDATIMLREEVRPAAAVVSDVSNDGVLSDIMIGNSMTDFGFARPWNLAGPFVPANSAPGDAAIRLDYITDGVDTEDSFEYAPGATINTAFGGAAASTGFQTGDTRGLNPGGVTTCVGFVSPDDTIDFNPDFYGGDLNDNMVYAATYLFLDEPLSNARAAVASDDSVQVKIDGIEVIIHNEGRGYGGAYSVQNRSPFLSMSAGRHKVVIKVFEGGGGHGFRFRMEDSSAQPVTEGIRYCLDPNGVDCGAGTDGESAVGKRIDWSLSRMESVDGVSYAVTENSQSQPVSLIGTDLTDNAALGGLSVGGRSTSNAFTEQTGPVGAFDNSHDIFAGTRTACDAVTETSYDPGSDSYVQTACGDDIWTGGDQFRFSYKKVSGDFYAAARITNREGGFDWGKHGIMARQTCAPNSRWAGTENTLSGNSMDMHIRSGHNDNNGSQAEIRQFSDFGRDTEIFKPVMWQPEWLALARRGQQMISFAANSEEDGSPGDWVFFGQADLAFPEEILVGTYITSHAGGAIGEIDFDSVQFSMPPEAPSFTEVDVASFNFDAEGPGAPPTGATVNVRSGAFSPVVMDGRLRLLEDGENSSGVSVLFPLPVNGADIGRDGFTAEFDVFMFKDDGMGGANTAPGSTADGINFVVFEGNSEQAVGAVGDGGGGLGYSGQEATAGTFRQAFIDEERSSFAVEVDLWVGTGSNEPSGHGTNEVPGTYHMGVNTNGQVTSVQTNVNYGVPDLPNVFDPDRGGLHVEADYTPGGVEGMARMQVYVSDNASADPFPRTQILDTPVSDLSGDLLVGFTGGTGGANVRAEIDNVTITGRCPEAVDGIVLSGDSPVEVGSSVEITAEFTGADGEPTLLFQKIAGPGTLSGEGSTRTLTSDEAGTARIRVRGNDESCGNFTTEEIQITFECPTEGDSTCDSLTLEGSSDGEFPGIYSVQAAGSDAGGDDVTYTFTVDGVVVAGPQADGAADIDLSAEISEPTTYTVAVLVDDNPLCDDAPGMCSLDITVTPKGGLQAPGDTNQSGDVDISDIIALLEHLFLGKGVLPCDGGTVDDPGNKALLNWNGDDFGIDISDAIYGLARLFTGGADHVLGNDCLRIQGCPNVEGTCFSLPEA